MTTKEVEWDGLPVPRRYWAILAIAMGITVSVLDGTIANVALPSIAADLNATPSMSIWIVNAYGDRGLLVILIIIGRYFGISSGIYWWFVDL